MTYLSFKVEGRPVPCGRPRFTNHAYKRSEDREYQKRITDHAILAMIQKGLKVPIKGDVGVTLDIHCWQRGDCENFAKNILDAMNGIVYIDDVQITELKVYLTRHEKKDADKFGVTVMIYDPKIPF